MCTVRVILGSHNGVGDAVASVLLVVGGVVDGIVVENKGVKSRILDGVVFLAEGATEAESLDEVRVLLESTGCDDGFGRCDVGQTFMRVLEVVVGEV